MIQSKGKAICLAVMLTVMLPAIAAAQPATPVWGEWTQDQTVTGCIEIQNGDTLTIYPGVTVSFEAGAKLIVRSGGTLVVDPSDTGCPDVVARVVFDGGDGIMVEAGGAATLRYVDIMNTTDTGLKIMEGASVGTMEYVTFSGCSGSAGGGLYTEQDLTISHGLFSGNSAGLYGGGIESAGGTLILQDVDFANNSATYSGGAIDLLGGSLVMIRGQLTGNSSVAGSAVMLYGAGAAISNAFFYNQSGGPVLQRTGTEGTAVSYATFNGNAGVACVAGDSDDNLVVFGSILYGNGSALDVVLDGGLVASITYSDVEDIGSFPSAWFGAGNIDLDPVLVTPGDWVLDPSSPCIGAALSEDMGVSGGASAPGPSPALIDITGAAVADPFDVGTASVGGSITRTIRLVNQGQDEATVAAADITGAQAAAFSLGALTLPVTLGPGECLDLQITFTPPAAGDYTLADLVITTTGDPVVNGLTGDTQEGSGNDLIVDPVTVNFGNVLTGTTSMPMAFTLTNPLANGGIVPVQLAVSGSDAGFFALSETDFTIPEDGTRTVWGTFTPNALRSFEAIVTPTVNGVERPDRAVLLVGAGNDTIFTALPNQIDFPPTAVGFTNDADITVTNLLPADSILVNAAISGPGASSFSLDMSSLPLAAAGSAPIAVTFTPPGDGFVQATVTLTSTLDGTDYVQTVDLRAFGVSTTAGLFVSPTAITFDDTSVGSMDEKTFTVVNLLNDFVTVNITAPGNPEFALGSSSSFVLFPTGDAASRHIRVVTLDFMPSDATTVFADSVDVTGTLGIFTVGSETVTMQGRGVESALDIAPDSIDYGDQVVGVPSSTVSVTVLNTGSESTTIFGGLLGGTDAADFEIVSNSCPVLSDGDPSLVLPPGIACFYELGVTPSAEGAREATLSIFSSEAPLPVEVDLAANGTPAAAAGISVTPTTVDLGDVAVFIPSTAAPGVGTVTITSTGAANLEVGAISFDGYDAAQFAATPPGPFTLAPGASQVVAVDLTATGIGPRGTTMTIPNNAGDVDVTVSGVSEVGYPNIDGFGWNPDATNGFIHARGETVYVVPGIGDFYWRQHVTALDALFLPADYFVWVEGAGFLQYLDSTGTWVAAADQTEIMSSDLGAVLALNGFAPLPASPALPAEGQFTLHAGFDLIRDNSITDLPVFYVDGTRTIVYGPHPYNTVTPTSLTVGDPDPSGTWAPNAGTSTTSVEVYIWVQDATGTTRYYDGVGTWTAATPASFLPVYTGDISLWPGAVAGVGQWYPITDSSQVGTHTIYCTFDRTSGGGLNDRLFENSVEVTVAPLP